MYRANIVTTSNLKIVYFTDALTLSNKIPTFINNLDNEPDSWNILPKFENWHPTNSDGVKDTSVLYGLQKWANPYFKESQSKLIERKALYITDSIMSGLKFCSKLYTDFIRIPEIEWPLNFQINKWNTNGSMGPHKDTYRGEKEFGISAVVYLNDDYEGGELYFPEYNAKIKPSAGSIVFFPSDTLHEALPVTKGEKYFAPFFSV